MPRLLAPFALVALAACSDFPDLAAPGLESALDAAYPRLEPIGALLASADTPPRMTAAEAEALAALAAALGAGRAFTSPSVTDPAGRLARLRARAAILRKPLDNEADFVAMRAALARLAP